jgi:hypothetical protein
MNVESLRVAFDEAIAVLIDTPNEIIRDADVDRAARSAREDVEIILSHGPELA